LGAAIPQFDDHFGTYPFLFRIDRVGQIRISPFQVPYYTV